MSEPNVPPEHATPAHGRARVVVPWSTIGAIAGCLGLALWAFCAYGAWRGLATLGTNCGPDDDRSMCQPSTLQLIMWTPFYSALLGLVVTMVGCWVWPRRHLGVWLSIGYTAAVIGLVAALALGSG